MRSFAIAALVGTASAAPAVIFAPGDAPACEVLPNGETAVYFTDSIHPSFKCTHNADNTACSCASNHPTHHTGLCREFDHTNGSNHKIDGDCTATGINSVDGAWSAWTTTACSATCGTGTTTSTRTCDGIVNGGADCSQLDGGSATKTESCKIKECPVNGGWTNYGACNSATGTKTRSCTNPSPAFEGTDCSGSTTANCDVAGGWSGWSGCTAAGTKTRSCNNPIPRHNGAQCSGSTSQDFSDCWEWKTVTPAMVGTSSTDAMHVTVSTHNGGAYIQAAANGERAPSCGQVSATTFIEGPWKKIKYTETMHGSASCYSIFGSRGYASGSASSNTVYESKSNTYDMGPEGRHQRCDNQSVNFWHGASSGANGAYGTVVMARSNMSAKAGVQTGVACFGSPSWTYKNMLMYVPKSWTPQQQWRRVTVSDVGSSSTDAMSVSVSTVGGGAQIHTYPNGARAPGCGQVSATTFIKGSWTKIKYTETMHGSASCYSIFGSRGYAAGSASSNTVFEDKWNVRDMGPQKLHQRCDNQSVNFWHGASGGAAGAKATVVMSRSNMNAAGVQTGVACFGSPSWTYNDIWILE